ncbi:hypothetical protein MK489_13750 [Myxococcota bacterium]|nr:hypothetical protein [Myxococcota bacterium]
MSAVRLLALLLLTSALPASAKPKLITGQVITEASRLGGKATVVIDKVTGDSTVAGEVVRNVVVKGDVVTRSQGGNGTACTSIGSVGGCGHTSGRDLRIRNGLK